MNCRCWRRTASMKSLLRSVTSTNMLRWMDNWRRAGRLTSWSVSLPFSLRLSWDPSRTVTRMTCHRRMTRIFSSVFSSIQARGLQDRITSFGGCFAFRPQRTGSKLSAHSWGIAIDLNPDSNPQGSAGNMDAGVIEIFRRAGFEWGRGWQGKTRDPMHFQFCTGY
jgi:hypothetical protein